MKKNSLPEITIYTDGACSPNPGPGGWAAIIAQDNEKTKEIKGGTKNTTNNRMEITAAIEALAVCSTGAQITLYTDSKYLQKGINIWLPVWQKNSWRTIDNNEVKNQDLWKKLSSQVSRHQISWHWLKGHSKNKWNDRADHLARTAVPRAPLPTSTPNSIHIFTAVSFRNKTKQGSWTAMLRYNSHKKLLYGSSSETTGNRLHIEAAIHGLTAVKRQCPIHIYTLSGYLRDGASKWCRQWEKNNWLTREGNKVSSQDLWEKLNDLNKNFSITYHVVPKDLPPCELLALKSLASEISQE